MRSCVVSEFQNILILKSIRFGYFFTNKYKNTPYYNDLEFIIACLKTNLFR